MYREDTLQKEYVGLEEALHGEPARVLVVDDNMKNLELIGGYLRNQACQMAFASTGEDGLEIMKDNEIDLVLLDVMMPGMDGFEVITVMRDDAALKEIPVIFLTARTEREDVVKGFRLGGQDYITKPFDRTEVMERVKTHVELKRSREYFRDMSDILEEKVVERTDELRKAMSELTVANKRLRKLDEAKRGFLKIISHELRTPLNGIRGFADILREANTDESFALYYDMLDSGISRLEEFSRLALDITYLYLQEEQLRFSRVNLVNLVESVMDDLAERVKKKGVVLAWEKNCRKCMLQADTDWLHKMITLLISNAVKHTAPETRITVVCDKREKYVDLSIRDMGPGFPKKLLDREVELFDNDEHVDLNAGLHLPMARLIAESHRGQFSISNNETRGARVDIRLPLAVSS